MSRCSVLLAVSLLLPLLLRPVAAEATPDATGGAAAADEALLSARDVLFAHSRLTDTRPDLEALARIELPMTEAPSPVPGAQLNRYRAALRVEEAELRRDFEGFNINRPQTLRVQTAIGRFDPALGGLPLGFNPSFWVRDPTWRTDGFVLRFTNAAPLRVLPAADEGEAEDSVAAAGYDARFDTDWDAVLELRFVFGGVLPRPAGMRGAPVAARVLSARLLSRDGTVVHDFGTIGRGVPRRDAPVLLTAALDGLRLDMPLAEARATLPALHAVPAGFALFEGLAAGSRRDPRAPRCDLDVVGNLRAFGASVSLRHNFRRCVAVKAAVPPPPEPEPVPAGRAAARAQEAEPDTTERLNEVTVLRFLPGADADAVRQKLERSFGAPVADGAGEITWIGRDPDADSPARASGTSASSTGASVPMVQLRAEFLALSDGGPDHEPGVLLGLQLTPFRPDPADNS